MTTKNIHRTLLPRTSRQHDNQQQTKHNNESIKQKQKISQQLKQKYIEDLQQRNKKLKNQIIKITQLLQQNQKQTNRSKPDPKKYKSKIAQSINTQNPQILKKQLQNVYKQIKNYQRQIQKTQNTKTGSRNYSDQITRLQIIKLQKLQHLEKLRSQLTELGNKQITNSKKLKNNMGRQQYETLIVKLGDQLKLLKQKYRNLQQKEKKKVQNAKKQLQYIRKLQGQLVQAGVAMDQIQQMKRKNVFIQVKNIMGRQKNPEQNQQSRMKINQTINQSEQQLITFQKLQQMKNQIKLYRKLHQDYQKRLSTIQKQKQNSDKLIVQKKKSIQDKNIQIEKLTQQINQVQQLVRKNGNLINGTASIGSGQNHNDSIRKQQRRKSIDINLQHSMDRSKNNNSAKNTKK